MTWTKAERNVYMKSYMQNWRRINREKALKIGRKSSLKWKKEHPEERREGRKFFNQIYNKLHPERKRAWNAAQYVDILDACEKCGSQVDVQKHHPDYSKPKEVRPLCRRCNVNEKKSIPTEVS